MTLADCQKTAAPAQVRCPPATGREKCDGTTREAPREAEFSKVQIFTAREIWKALGGTISKQAVLARLGDIPPDGEKTVRGQTAQAWRVESFPHSLFAELEEKCFKPDGTRAYRTVADRIANAPISKKTAVPLSNFPADAITIAERKAEILAPMLHAREKNPAKWTVAKIARDARRHFAGLPGGMPSGSAVEKWAREALKRDGDCHQFEDARLYLPAVARQAHGAAPEAMRFAQLDSLLSSCEPNPPSEVRDRIWNCAFLIFTQAVQNGAKAGTARRAVIQNLRIPSSPFYTTDPVALAKAWHRKFPQWKENGMTPEALADGRANNARPVKYELTRDEKLCLRKHHLERGSLPLAVEWFAKDKRCLPATRALILDTMDAAARAGDIPYWPDSIRRAGHVTEEEKAAFRGRKAMQKFETCDRRGLIWIGEDGSQNPLLPGTLFESDDMSSNEPFGYTDLETGGKQLGRQMLFSQDNYSAAWLGFTPVGRVRDAYRVEDIADHMLAIVEAHGLPGAWRLERGIWQNTFIDGLDVSELTGRKDETWGGLGALFTLIRAWKSKQKGGIESAFNFLQNLVSHESLSIGRERGEFEAATRDYLRAQGGNAGAAEKFWDIADCADAYVRACDYFNNRPKKRRAHGKKAVVANDLFRNAVRRDCPASELWRFLPVKREATVRQGVLEFSVNHYPMNFRFRVNGTPGSDLHLGHGYKVLVAFHPGKPEIGCHVFNGEMGPRNRDGHRFGAPLLIAPLAEDAPQFSLTRSEQDAFAMRRKAAAAVRTEFRAIMPAGRAASRISVARDGRGNSTEIVRNARRRIPHTAGTGDRTNKVQEGDVLIAGARAAHSRGEVDYDALAKTMKAEEAAWAARNWLEPSQDFKALSARLEEAEEERKSRLPE